MSLPTQKDDDKVPQIIERAQSPDSEEKRKLFKLDVDQESLREKGIDTATPGGAGVADPEVPTSEEVDTLERIDGLEEGRVDFLRKAHVLNKVMEDHVGMGLFQWQIFALTGMGWLLGLSYYFPRTRRNGAALNVSDACIAIPV